MNSSVVKRSEAIEFFHKRVPPLITCSSNIFITLVGTLLLVASLLKWAAVDGSTTEFAFVPFLELAMGAGLIVFRTRTWVLSVTVLFSIFVLVLVYKTWVGASNCGCLGAFSPPPLTMLALDLLIVGWGVVLVAKCSFRDQLLPSLAIYGRISCICFLIIGASLTLWWRSFGAMSATIIGRQAFVDLAEYKRVEVGTGEFEEVRYVELSNLSPWNSMKLVGYRSSCSCLYLKDFPIVVAPMSSVKLPLYFEGVTPLDEKKSFERPVRVMLTAADGTTNGLSFTVAIAFQGSN